MTLSVKSIFVDVNKLRLSREDYPGLKKTLNVLTRILMEDRERRKPCKMGAEVVAMLPQAKEHQETPEAGRGIGRYSKKLWRKHIPANNLTLGQ